MTLIFYHLIGQRLTRLINNVVAVNEISVLDVQYTLFYDVITVFTNAILLNG